MEEEMKVPGYSGRVAIRLFFGPHSQETNALVLRLLRMITLVQFDHLLFLRNILPCPTNKTGDHECVGGESFPFAVVRVKMTSVVLS